MQDDVCACSSGHSIVATVQCHQSTAGHALPGVQPAVGSQRPSWQCLIISRDVTRNGRVCCSIHMIMLLFQGRSYSGLIGTCAQCCRLKSPRIISDMLEHSPLNQHAFPCCNLLLCRLWRCVAAFYCLSNSSLFLSVSCLGNLLTAPSCLVLPCML